MSAIHTKTSKSILLQTILPNFHVRSPEEIALIKTFGLFFYYLQGELYANLHHRIFRASPH